ncbi:MAG TPA: hypothetical protein VHG93_03325, partial [Longimicrobium sp.]|nr:hypothetical protein [Longimicrobium sp.]
AHAPGGGGVRPGGAAPGPFGGGGRDARRDPSTWSRLRALWIAIVRSVLAGGRDVLLCGPARAGDFRHGTFDGTVRCAWLDCPGEVRAGRLRARGEAEQDIEGELRERETLRASMHLPIPAGGRSPHDIAADAAAWVRAARADVPSRTGA